MTAGTGMGHLEKMQIRKVVCGGHLRWNAKSNVFISSRPTRRSSTQSTGSFRFQPTAVHQMFTLKPYEAPPWAQKLALVPKERFCLGLLPTPVHEWKPSGFPKNLELWIKRDDLSGMQMSGNKVRKLEFLMADAKAGGHDCIITIGGIQSNHCRATAVAARYLEMDSHLILRNSARGAESDPSLTGNLLVERLVGAHVHQVTKEEYNRVGSKALGEILALELQKSGKNPYVIPVGGSSSVGTWGYIECVHELLAQIGDEGFTDIVVACGSGGTSGGLALGVYLSGWDVTVHSYGVCDDEDYFYDYIDGLYKGLGAGPHLAGKSARDLFRAVQAKGAGYAIAQDEELTIIKDIALSTGIILDPVYSGKAMVSFLDDVERDPESWEGRKVLFIHTGGLLGMYDKVDQLQPMIEGLGKCSRMVVP